MSESTVYHVRIRGAFTANVRRRAGIEVSVEDGYTGPLDKEQLAAVKADPVLVVTKGAPAADDSGQEQAKQIVADARTEAEKIVSDAKAEAEKIVADAKEAAKKAPEQK